MSEELDQIGARDPVLALLRARAFLEYREFEGAESALDLLSENEEALTVQDRASANALRAALSIERSEDWTAAVALLEKLPSSNELAPLLPLARIRARAGIAPEHVANLPDSLAAVLIGWSQALRGEAGAHALREAMATDCARAETAPLLGWLRLQEARRAADQGDQAGAIGALQEAAKLWPEVMNQRDGDEERLLMLLPDRPAEARNLIARTNREPGDPSVCHRVALCWLGEAGRRAREQEWAKAAMALERSLANWAVPLCDDEWMQGWLRDRSQIWNRQIEGDPVIDLRARFAKYIETLATSWSTATAHTNESLAERLQLVPVLWDAECHAALRLRKSGGMPLDDGRKIVAGPGYIEEHSLSEEFRSFIEEAEFPGEWSDEMHELMQLLGISARDLAAAVETESARTDLQISFSAARVACALERNGELDRAVGWLRRMPTVPDATNYGDGWRLECAGTGFDPVTEREDYAAATARLLIDWLLKKGEHGIAGGTDALSDGMEAWREAIQLADAQGADAGEAARQRVRHSVMGRCDVLRRAERLEDAHALLERGRTLLPNDEHLRSLLANCYVDAGVDLANNRKDFDGALEWMRKAQKVAPDLPRVMNNAALCLHLAARGPLEAGQFRRAADLFKDASEVAMRCLTVDPGNKEMRELNAEANRGFLYASERLGTLRGVAATGRGPSHAIEGSESFIESLLASDTGGHRALSTMYHNQALEKAKAHRWKEAIALFEKALVYEPDSDVTKKMLAQSLMGLAHDGMERNAPVDEVRGLIRRAASLDPHDPLIRTLDSIL